MAEKLLIPLHGNDIAPRFDLATEVLIISTGEKDEGRKERTVVLSQVSAEQLCHLVLTEGADVVVCGGIEEEYYQYLTWKRVKVLDSVIGPWKSILELYQRGKLNSGTIIHEHRQELTECSDTKDYPPRF